MIAAINAGKIPPDFQEPLQARANELVNAVNCPQPSTDDQSDEEDKKKDKKTKEGKQQSDEVVVPTEPLPTVPEGEG